jgi:hypothetical protein
MTWKTDKKTRRERGTRGRMKAAEVLGKLRIQSLDELDVEAMAFHHGLRVRYGGLSGAQGGSRLLAGVGSFGSPTGSIRHSAAATSSATNSVTT